MRIATSQYHATMTTALQAATTRSENMLQRLASGQKLLLPSDDPVTAVRLSRLEREETALKQYRGNISALGSRLQQNESLLDGMNNDLMAARDQMVWASNGGNTPSDTAAMASTLKALRDSMLYTSNSRDQEGRYLFSGTLTNAPTISVDASAVPGARYSSTGNNQQQMVVVGNGVTQWSNVTLGGFDEMLNLLDRAVAICETPGVDVNDPATRAELVAALNGIDKHLDQNTSRIAKLGGAQNTLQSLDDNHANVSLSNKQASLTLGALDYSEAAVALESYSTALQATQKAYAKVSGLSLFDVL